ncbi:hypothetical protein HT136_02220 [Novosphingobium profundi]|uniref:hypothetical protein n=1 Tax=Novosphingobium profundi TaxID=1774954 RepID=UPI001BDB531C|nr:hypothetical protein [Novosphingobium profundi]MBT0667183.1 hypothetical protein [Novosphingobium profundi]
MASTALDRLLRKEQAVSAAINAALSAAFFALVFGFAERPLAMGAPDNFAIDFLPQGLMVSLMAALVPSLLVRSRLRKDGRVCLSQGPGGGVILREVLVAVLAGCASAALLMTFALVGPLDGVSARAALAFKIVYGAGLGLLCTRRTLVALYGRFFEGAQA